MRKHSDYLQVISLSSILINAHSYVVPGRTAAGSSCAAPWTWGLVSAAPWGQRQSLKRLDIFSQTCHRPFSLLPEFDEKSVGSKQSGTPIGCSKGTMERTIIILLFSAACVQLAVAELVLTLDSKDWTMMNENGTLSLKTNVPAYPLEVLRSQGVIGDPLYRWVTIGCCCCCW